MTKGFGKSRDSDIPNEEKKARILQKLNDERDTILGFFWKNYLTQGNGAVIIRAVEDEVQITYRPQDKINDYKDLKIVLGNDPNIGAVVFAYFKKNEYLVTTLIGPKTPPECYEDL